MSIIEVHQRQQDTTYIAWNTWPYSFPARTMVNTFFHKPIRIETVSTNDNKNDLYETSFLKNWYLSVTVVVALLLFRYDISYKQVTSYL